MRNVIDGLTMIRLDGCCGRSEMSCPGSEQRNLSRDGHHEPLRCTAPSRQRKIMIWVLMIITAAIALMA